MSTTNLTSRTCIWFSCVCIFAALINSELMVLAFSLVALLCLAFSMNSKRSVFKMTLLWILPIALPLLVIHGIINPSFDITVYAAAYIPIRIDGLTFASTLSLKLGLFTLAVAIWKNISRESAFAKFLSVRWIPYWMVIVIMQSISLVDHVSRRSESIFLAQQARGIQVRGSFISRIKALPKIIIPLIASTLVESDERATALGSRGFGAARLTTRHSDDSLKYGDYIFAALLTIICITSVRFGGIWPIQ